MSAVSEISGKITTPEERLLSQTHNGYSYFRTGDILVAKITPCFENGKIAFVEIPHRHGFGSTEFHVIRPDEQQICARYLFHFLRQTHIRLEGERKMTGSAGQRRVPRHFLEALEVPLFSISDQKRIASILDAAKSLQEKRRRAIGKLDSLTQSVFLEMFGDPIGNLKRWRSSTVGEQLAFQQYGPRFYNEVYAENGVRIVRISDLDNRGTLDFDKMPRLDVSEMDRCKYALRFGDLIFARSGATVGKVALIPEGAPPCIAGAYFITMRFNGNINPLYARGLFQTPSIRTIVSSRSRQSAQQNFSGPALRALPMPVPPLSIQNDFATRIRSIEALRPALSRSLANLNSLARSLENRFFRRDL
jgi:type I restriction enzyme S subunit